METSTAPLWNLSNLHTNTILLCPVWINEQCPRLCCFGWKNESFTIERNRNISLYLSKLVLPSVSSLTYKIFVKRQDIHSGVKVVVSEPHMNLFETKQMNLISIISWRIG
jgi:hypothetical protein